MMAFSGVRNSWLMVARNRVLEASAPAPRRVRASSSACSCSLRSVTSRITATTSCSDLRRQACAVERAAAHLDPDEIGRMQHTAAIAGRIAAQAEFDARCFAAAARHPTAP